MLLDLRETVRNSKPIKYTLITLICIPFVLFGVGSYFSGGNAPVVATVNGEDITQVELDGATQRQRRQLAQMFGGQLPEAFADERVLRQQALDQLVTQRVLEETVAEQRFAVGDATLGRAIRDLPAFQVDGRFDSDTYERQVRASGLSVGAFEQSFRDDTAMSQFRTGVVDTSFTLPSEAGRLDALARQTRTVDAVRFDLDVAKASITPSEEDVTAFFDENGERYVFPERFKLDWVELDAAALASDIDVTEEQALARYEENRSSYVRPEQREASHILLMLDDGAGDDEVAEKTATLEAARERVAGGEAFADVARELSEDVGSAESGGSLGVIAPGAMVPEFEEAVFALEEEGSLSAPVRTDFGLHLVRLDRITAESGKPFEEVRDEIVTEMRSAEADREFFELRGELTEIVFDESTSLEPAADATGLEVKSTDWLDADTIGEAGSVLSNPAILAAANDPEVREAGNNSELIEVGPRHVVALRVTESEGPRPKTLDDVREQVVDEIRAERAAARLDELADAAVEALEGGAEPGAVAAEAGAGSVAEAGSETSAGSGATTDAGTTAVGEDEGALAEAFVGEALERQSTTFDGGVIAEIFALARPEEGASRTGTATLGDGDRLAYVLRAVESPVAPAEGEESMPTGPTAGADPRLGNVEFEALLGSLRGRADVDAEL